MFDKAVDPSQTWANSCASVNICAALESAPLMKTNGARGSASAKPRNSEGSSRRWLLLADDSVHHDENADVVDTLMDKEA